MRKTFSIAISSGKVDPDTGNLIDIFSFGLTVSVRGELTSACQSRRVGETELPGGWQTSSTPLVEKASSRQLSFMCVSEQNAYIPEKVWTDNFGDFCECTLDDTVIFDPE